MQRKHETGIRDAGNEEKQKNKAQLLKEQTWVSK